MTSQVFAIRVKGETLRSDAIVVKMNSSFTFLFFSPSTTVTIELIPLDKTQTINGFVKLISSDGDEISSQELADINQPPTKLQFLVHAKHHSKKFSLTSCTKGRSITSNIAHIYFGNIIGDGGDISLHKLWKYFTEYFFSSETKANEELKTLLSALYALRINYNFEISNHLLYLFAGQKLQFHKIYEFVHSGDRRNMEYTNNGFITFCVFYASNEKLINRQLFKRLVFKTLNCVDNFSTRQMEQIILSVGNMYKTEILSKYMNYTLDTNSRVILLQDWIFEMTILSENNVDRFLDNSIYEDYNLFINWEPSFLISNDIFMMESVIPPTIPNVVPTLEMPKTNNTTDIVNLVKKLEEKINFQQDLISLLTNKTDLLTSMVESQQKTISELVAMNGNDIGKLELVPSTTKVPPNWMECDGRCLSVKEYPQLFETLQTKKFEDGTFNIPKINIFDYLSSNCTYKTLIKVSRSFSNH